MIKTWGLEHLIASNNCKYLENYSTYLKEGLEATKRMFYLKYSKMPSQVLDACRTRLRRARGLVRPGAAGLLIGIEIF